MSRVNGGTHKLWFQGGKDAQLDATLDEVDGLSRAEERAHDRVLPRHFPPELLPLLGVADPPPPRLVDLAVVGGALKLLKHRISRLEQWLRGVSLKRRDALREDADAGVRRERDTRVTSSGENLELDRHGALLGHAEAGKGDAVCSVDPREALVEHKRDAVLAIARLECRREVCCRAVTADLFVEPGREDDGAAGAREGSGPGNLAHSVRCTHREGLKSSSMSLSRAAKRPMSCRRGCGSEATRKGKR